MVSIVLTADNRTHSEHGPQPAPQACMGFSYTKGQSKGNRTMCREGDTEQTCTDGVWRTQVDNQAPHIGGIISVVSRWAQNGIPCILINGRQRKILQHTEEETGKWSRERF